MSDKGWYQIGDFACSCEIPYIGAQTTLPTRCERCGGIITGQIAAEPSPLPPSEQKELQVSLLNALGAQLAEQAETLKTYKLSLEGIQGLLVDNEAGIGTLGEGIAAILARLDHDSIAGLWERLGRIEDCQEKHRLALESITRILEKVTGTTPKKRQPKRVRKVTKR